MIPRPWVPTHRARAVRALKRKHAEQASEHGLIRELAATHETVREGVYEKMRANGSPERTIRRIKEQTDALIRANVKASVQDWWDRQ